MEEKPKVLLDVDGVLADFVNPYLETLYKITGVKRTMEEITTWDIKASLGLPPETVKVMSECIKSPGWCLNIPVLPGAHDGVTALREIADIHIITSPWDGPNWQKERETWLGHYFGFKPEEITQTHHKEKYAGDYLVDDKYVTLVKWAPAHPNGRPVLWSTPNNRLDDDTWRIEGWEELLRIIGMWEKK